MIKEIEQVLDVLDVRGQPAKLAEIGNTLMKMYEKPREIVKDLGTEQDRTNSTSSPLSGTSHQSINDFGSPIEAHRRRIGDLEKPVLQLAEKLRASETLLGEGPPGQRQAAV